MVVATLLLSLLPGSGGFSLASHRHGVRVPALATPRASALVACDVKVVRAEDAAAAAAHLVDNLGALLPPPADLADEELLKIVLSQTTDEETNNLVWKYLGYKLDAETGEWDMTAVFPNWRKNFPTPPDLVGVTRTYSREVDEPVLKAVQSLQKSVPSEHKNNLKTFLKPLGWTGFKMEGLTPNMTRRAQVANWLMYYREALHGVPIEELRRRKEARAAREASAREENKAVPPTGTTKQSVI